MSERITLGLLDEQTIFRKTLKYFLDEQANMRVIVQASASGELFEKLDVHRPEILLLDPFMRRHDGIGTVRILRRQFPAIKLVLVSVIADVSMVSGLMDLGIQGFVSKHDGPNDLLQLIQWVAEGRVLRNRHLRDALHWDARPGDDGWKRIDLDRRERRVLQMIWDEKNDKEIAAELFLSAKSIEKIRLDMKVKLGVRSTIGLLKYAVKHRIIAGSILI